ncbi:MAG: hypothetical protein Q4C49_06825 [Bacillota bacterium]|nr:hypothetical protein [Bacillota bacterium]
MNAFFLFIVTCALLFIVCKAVLLKQMNISMWKAIIPVYSECILIKHLMNNNRNVAIVLTTILVSMTLLFSNVAGTTILSMAVFLVGMFLILVENYLPQEIYSL